MAAGTVCVLCNTGLMHAGDLVSGARQPRSSHTGERGHGTVELAQRARYRAAQSADGGRRRGHPRLYGGLLAGRAGARGGRRGRRDDPSRTPRYRQEQRAAQTDHHLRRCQHRHRLHPREGRVRRLTWLVSHAPC